MRITRETIQRETIQSIICEGIGPGMEVDATVPARVSLLVNLLPTASKFQASRIGSCPKTIVSQPNKCLKFMTFREGCFVIRN